MSAFRSFRVSKAPDFLARASSILGSSISLTCFKRISKVVLAPARSGLWYSLGKVRSRVNLSPDSWPMTPSSKPGMNWPEPNSSLKSLAEPPSKGVPSFLPVKSMMTSSPFLALRLTTFLSAKDLARRRRTSSMSVALVSGAAFLALSLR